jgi:Barrel-sandwich domain of CusB or HlyD membrane-fusion
MRVAAVGAVPDLIVAPNEDIPRFNSGCPTWHRHLGWVDAGRAAHRVWRGESHCGRKRIPFAGHPGSLGAGGGPRRALDRRSHGNRPGPAPGDGRGPDPRADRVVAGRSGPSSDPGDHSGRARCPRDPGPPGLGHGRPGSIDPGPGADDSPAEGRRRHRGRTDAIQARHQVAEAAVAEARALLTHTKVVAPFDGVITRRLADVGDLASPGRPLVEIEDPAHLRFELDVPEALIDRVQMGAVLPVRMGNRAQGIEGTVSELSPVADAASRTFRVKLDLPVTPGVRAGQFGRVAVPTSEAQVLQVPSTAVVRRGQLEFVYVAAQGQASLRLIRTGRVFGAVSEVVTGLRTGEKVVEKPDSALRDGQRVEGTP